MRHYLGELLEALEESYPEGLRVGELRERFSLDIDDRIHDAVRGRLIFYPNYDPGGNFLPETKIYLDVNGFGLLNQMKMKEAVDQLDVSIRRFNESNDKTAFALIVLTIVLIVLAFIAVSNTPYRILAGGFSILGIVIIIRLLKK